MANQQIATSQSSRRQDDVRYIGALTGCYTLSERREASDEEVPVYACRLCSISPLQAVIVAPIIARLAEPVAAHFRDFGMLRGPVLRPTSTGFVLDLELDDDARDKLAAKIRWKKDNARNQVVDKREFKRVLPRHPRTVMTAPDGSTEPCFVIDISQSGVAVSAKVVPPKGTPLAIGGLIGRVVRRLDVGFAVEFIDVQPLEGLEDRMAARRGVVVPRMAA